MAGKLTKKQRAELFLRFKGCCAYCGCSLEGKRWHADHVDPVIRQSRYVKGKGFVQTGKLYRPQNDHKGNFMPACAPCNISKADLDLESWRQVLHDMVRVLKDNYPTFRHALRFGLVKETGDSIVFHFERLAILRNEPASLERVDPEAYGSAVVAQEQQRPGPRPLPGEDVDDCGRAVADGAAVALQPR